MKYKLTVDGNLMRARELSPAAKTLRVWEGEGKVEIFEAEHSKAESTSPGWPGGARPAAPPAGGRFRPVAKKSGTAAAFGQLSGVLFPFRDPHRLSMTEINDVAHLLQHRSLGREFFVTTNERHFISEGRRERLKAGFSIEVLTPDEVVAMLTEREQWGEPASAAGGKRK